MNLLLAWFFRFIIPLAMIKVLYQFQDFLDEREQDTQWRQRAFPGPRAPSRQTVSPAPARPSPFSSKRGSDCAGKRISL